MFIRDQEGVLSSVVYDPSQRTRLSPVTTAAMFTVYVPTGTQRAALQVHLA